MSTQLNNIMRAIAKMEAEDHDERFGCMCDDLREVVKRELEQPDVASVTDTAAERMTDEDAQLAALLADLVPVFNKHGVKGLEGDYCGDVIFHRDAGYLQVGACAIDEKTNTLSEDHDYVYTAK